MSPYDLGKQGDMVLPDELEVLVKEKQSIKKELEKPFKDFQVYKQKLKEWEAKKKRLLGDETASNSITFLEKELKYLKDNLKSDVNATLEGRALISLGLIPRRLRR